MGDQNRERIVESGFLYRTFELDRNAINEEERTVEILCTTEDIVDDSWFGPIILDHSPGSVRMDRMTSGRAPLLMDHDPTDVIGVIKASSFSTDRGGRVTARFGRSARAEEIFRDVLDGIRSNVSIGAKLYEGEEFETEDGREAIRFTDWEPVECSVVYAGANPLARILRHDLDPKFKTVIRCSETEHPDHQSDTEAEQPTAEEINSEPTPTAEEEVIPNMVDTITEEDRTAAITSVRDNETKRVRLMIELGEKHNCRDKAKEFIHSDKTPENLSAWILDNKKTEPTRTTDRIDFSAKEAASYSVMKALNLMSDPKAPRSGLEFDVSQELEHRFGTTAKGLFIPSRMLTHDLATVTPNTAGAALVGTDHLAGEFIDLLRPQLVVGRAGARTMGGLVGNVSIPRQSGGSTVYWVDENTDVTESNLTTEALTLSMKTMGAVTDLTRSQRIQTSPSAELLVIQDIRNSIAQELDRAALEGSGSANQPTGLFNISGLNTVTSGTVALTFANYVAMETEVATDNADYGALAYITTSQQRGVAKQTPEHATATRGFIWENGDEPGTGIVNGYRAFTTNVFTAKTNPVFFGNWNDLIIGQWAAVDLTVDPYSLSKSGGLRVVAFLNVDIGARHPQSFCKIVQ